MIYATKWQADTGWMQPGGAILNCAWVLRERTNIMRRKAWLGPNLSRSNLQKF
jgi:hypothetical protein